MSKRVMFREALTSTCRSEELLKPLYVVIRVVLAKLLRFGGTKRLPTTSLPPKGSGSRTNSSVVRSEGLISMRTSEGRGIPLVLKILLGLLEALGPSPGVKRFGKVGTEVGLGEGEASTTDGLHAELGV